VQTGLFRKKQRTQAQKKKKKIPAMHVIESLSSALAMPCARMNPKRVS
jgi:hypothetical protein